MPTIEDNTLFLGKVFFEYKSLKSTNSLALDILSNSRPAEGTVVSAVHQTQGKGQYGSTWEANPGENITLSIILYPNFLPIGQQFMLTKAVSLGVRDLLARYDLNDLYVKWPNDLYAGQQKTGGILIQNSIQGNRIQYAVVGIGLNINQSSFPPDLDKATSLFLQTGKVFDLAQIRQGLFKCIELRYLELRSGDWSRLDRDYSGSLFQFEKWAMYEDQNGRFTGKITGVSKTGQLLVRDQNDDIRKYGLKEVKFLNTL